MAAGMSFADWKAQIRNLDAFLTRVARCAAIDEARKILHLKAKTKGPAKGELLAYITPPLLMGFHDPAELTLGFVQRTLPFHERASCLEHFRTCVQCFSLLQAITRRKKEGIDPAFVSLVDALEVKKDAIEINLLIKDSIEWDFLFFRKSQFFFARDDWDRGVTLRRKTNESSNIS